MDTWDEYFGAPYTHGTPSRRAFEEGLLVEERSINVGIRGPLYAETDRSEDASMGFRVVTAMELETGGVAGVVERVPARLGDAPVYLSIDVDVLYPALASGPGTPEVGELTSRELPCILRCLAGAPIVSADIVEVSPAHHHSELTSIAECHAAYELLGLTAGSV